MSVQKNFIEKILTIIGYLSFGNQTRDKEEIASLPRWVRIYLRLRFNLRDDHLGLIAAGIAFFFLLAAFPALAAAVSLYGLFLDPGLITQQLSMMENFLPAQAMKILSDQIYHLEASSNKALSLSIVFSLMVTLYAATKGVNALIKGLNIAFNMREKRKFLKRVFVAYGLTFMLVIHFLISLMMVAGFPMIINLFPIPDFIADPMLQLRWPILFGMALIGLQILYNLGPCFEKPCWRFVSVGSITATILWIGGCGLFSAFVTNFPNFNEAYGSLSAVVLLLLWFWLSALMILFGAELNASISEVD